MKFFLIIFFLVLIFFPVISIQPVFALTAEEQFKAGLNATGDKTGHTQLENFNEPESLPQTIGQIIKFLLSFLGVFFLGLTIYGGYLWMTARGNDTQLTQAKSVLRNAIIGLVIVLISYGITSFVINTFDLSISSGTGTSEIDEFIN